MSFAAGPITSDTARVLFDRLAAKFAALPPEAVFFAHVHQGEQHRDGVVVTFYPIVTFQVREEHGVTAIWDATPPMPEVPTPRHDPLTCTDKEHDTCLDAQVDAHCTCRTCPMHESRDASPRIEAEPTILPKGLCHYGMDHSAHDGPCGNEVESEGSR